jgi:hypothetical protein
LAISGWGGGGRWESGKEGIPETIQGIPAERVQPNRNRGQKKTGKKATSSLTGNFRKSGIMVGVELNRFAVVWLVGLLPSGNSLLTPDIFLSQQPTPHSGWRLLLSS